MLTRSSLLLVCLTWIIACDYVSAASLDCADVVTDSEVTICDDEELRAFDRIMGILWNEQSTPSLELQEIQQEWLEQRNLCGSDIDCLRQSYRDRLSEAPYHLHSFEVVQLYDFQTEAFAQYLFTNIDYAYNIETFVFAFSDEGRREIPWVAPQFSEEITTCGLTVLSDANVDFELSQSELGWTNVLDEGYRERSLQTGEISVFTKWIGHGDLSSEVVYRLTGGRFVPDRALVDSCEDQEQVFASMFFDNPLKNLEAELVYVHSPELQLEGDIFDEYDSLSQQCEQNGPNMGAIRMCLMGLADTRMQAILLARTEYFREAGLEANIDSLVETQIAFEAYRTSSCDLIHDINHGWIADDATMNCYNRLTNQRTEFLNTQWLLD